MNKERIDRVLASGSVKQRTVLLANHITKAKFSGKGILTDEEFSALSNSFKTEREVAAYNCCRKNYDRIRIFLKNLSEWRFACSSTTERLEKYVLLRRSNHAVKELTTVLLELMPDKETKKCGIERVKTFISCSLMRGIRVDAKGCVQFTTEDARLDLAIKETRNSAERKQIELKTGIAVVKDFIAETGFNVKAFAAYLKEIENCAKERRPETKDFASIEVDQKLYAKLRSEFFVG